MSIAVLGAGAFGTALAISFARGGRDVTLWARNEETAREMQNTRENTRRLPGVTLPKELRVTANMPHAETVLLAVPMQQVAGVVRQYSDTLRDRHLVACCKGLSIDTGAGPTAALTELTRYPAVLTGPSFAADIAKGLPTALTLACADDATGTHMQNILTAPNLRLYRTTDVAGAEIGGALKNVVAIGCGAVMGAGLGVSARAALMTRGFAEMARFAETAGAKRATLMGLSGLGDLTLSCTSDLSRNYRHGFALGQGKSDGLQGHTVEGAATARALLARASRENIDMPVTASVAALLDGRIDVSQAMADLLSRPPKEE